VAPRGADIAKVLVTAALLAVAGGALIAQGGSGQLNGTIFDERNKGIAGLSIALVSEQGSTLYGTNSGEEGRYAFKGLEAGVYSVVVAFPAGGVERKDGIRVRPLFRSIVDFHVSRPPTEGTIPAPRAQADPDAEAAKSLSIRCLLLDPDRQPVPDIHVSLTPVDGTGRLERARTDPDGACILPDVEAGDYRLSASAPGYMTWSLGPLRLEGEGRLSLSLLLVPFPMGFPGTIEDLLIPPDPIPPTNEP